MAGGLLLHGRFTVDCPAERVWDYVSDHHHDLEWRGGLSRIEQTPAGALVEGSRVREWMSGPPGVRIETEVEVISLESGRSYGYRSIKGPLPVTGGRKISPAPSGVLDEVVYEEQLSVQFPGAWRLLAPLGRLMLRRTFALDLARLRSRLGALGLNRNRV